MPAHVAPKALHRVGFGLAALLLLLCMALFAGFHVVTGTGCACALHAVWALAIAACLTGLGLGLACFVAHARAGACHRDAKVAERLDRIFQNVNAKDS